tara:strand:- start:2075 stop:2860 length:786 start_codon:yes stop_codon:yes gene_type:complete
MTELDAFILGVIQGLTEFLPVSSSGHLEITRSLLNANQLDSENTLMTVVLHFGTALSTIIIFKKDILDLFRGAFKKKSNSDQKYLLNILISMIPAAIVGFIFEQDIESLFSGNLILVGIMLILTGLLLFLTKVLKPKSKEIKKSHSLIIGISQAIAVIPGVSRSGATICTSILLGNKKNEAAKFSFLMVIPVIFGKISKDIFGGNLFTENVNFLVLTIGFLSALITGVVACKLMLNIVKKNNLVYFSYYCIILGLISIFII